MYQVFARIHSVEKSKHGQLILNGCPVINVTYEEFIALGVDLLTDSLDQVYVQPYGMKGIHIIDRRIIEPIEHKRNQEQNIKRLEYIREFIIKYAEEKSIKISNDQYNIFADLLDAYDQHQGY